MNVKLNNKYINGKGEIVEIVKLSDLAGYPFKDNEDCSYTVNGIFDKDEKTEFDLICEVNEDIYTAYKQDVITKKEFLNKHFEFYAGATIEEYNKRTVSSVYGLVK